MRRMIIWTVVGGIGGACVTVGIYCLAFIAHPIEFFLGLCLAVMGAFPVAVVAAIFAGVSLIRKELREINQQISSFKTNNANERSMDQTSNEMKEPSTGIKAGQRPDDW